MWIDLLFLRLPLAVWVGGTFAVVLAAPVVFREAPSRDLAGRIFGDILSRLEAVKHALSVLIVFGVFSAVSRSGRIDGLAAVTAVASFLAIASNVYVSMVVRPRMAYYRSKIGSFDAAPDDDPWRRKFARLHSWSTRAVSVGLLCATVALLAAP
jgi:UDP-N-acetylmuramyl pentapeptide phosphotransferase/UDP-N-acetylglucosamine-1-phosphate transferase